MKKLFIFIFSVSFILSADYIFLKTYSNITNAKVLDKNDLESIDILFEEELSSYDFGSVKNLSKSCPDNQCAIDELKKTDSQFIVYTRIIKLGDKLRYSGTILNKDGVVFNAKLIVMNASEIHFVKGRLKFGDSKNSAPFPSAVVVFDGGDELWRVEGINK